MSKVIQISTYLNFCCYVIEYEGLKVKTLFCCCCVIVFSHRLKHLWWMLTLFAVKLYMHWIISMNGWSHKGYFQFI